MDNLTHALTGALIARTLPAKWSGEPVEPSAFDPGGERPGRWVLWSSVIAANLPDFEALILWPPPLGDKVAYLLHHRGWSHSLVGIAGEALLFAGLLWVLYRLTSPERKLRPTSAASRTSSRPVTGACRTAGACAPDSPAGAFVGFTPLRGLTVAGLGAGSHLFLDWWNSYGVRPFYPWDESWYYGDLVFIVDPWVWLMLGGALICGTRRFGRAKWGWYALTAAATLVVAGACWKEQCPWWVLAGWCTGVVEIALLRWWGRWRGAAGFGWALLAAYLVAIGWGKEARVPYNRSDWTSSWAHETKEPIADLPVAGVPWERIVVSRQTNETFGDLTFQQSFFYSGDRISLIPAFPATKGSVPVPLHHVAADLGGDPRWRAWRAFARFPTAVLLEVDDRSTLILGDARWPLQSPDGGDWSTLKIELEERSSTDEMTVDPAIRELLIDAPPIVQELRPFPDYAAEKP